MKARLCDGATQCVAVPVLCTIEGDHQIKRAMCHLTYASCDNAGMPLVFRYTDSAFMRVRGEILNHAGSRVWVIEEFMNRLNGRDSLIVAVAARMIVRPRDSFSVLIVALVS